MPLSEASELFLKYNYAETKDLCKHFLTVVTAVLVFSLTFSEKIIDYKNAVPLAKALLLASWTLFFASIIACGIGLVFISLAGGAAVYQGIPPQPPQALVAYKLIVVAGFSFILGLLSLMATGFVAVLSHKYEPPKPPGVTRTIGQGEYRKNSSPNRGLNRTTPLARCRAVRPEALGLRNTRTVPW